ncbi:MAG: MarR family winged helix-turn-helix transcriptional regulator [Candidatus Goldiibacteriota bacterium]
MENKKEQVHRHRDLDAEVGWNLYRTGMLMRREGVRQLAEFNVTPEQWQVLMILINKGGLSQKAIGDITLQDAPTISRVLQRLLKKKLIKKKTDVRDKRAFCLEITGAGKDLMEKMMKKLKKNRTEYNITDSQKRELIKLLKGLRENLEVIHSKGGTE